MPQFAELLNRLAHLLLLKSRMRFDLALDGVKLRGILLKVLLFLDFTLDLKRVLFFFLCGFIDDSATEGVLAVVLALHGEEVSDTQTRIFFVVFLFSAVPHRDIEGRLGGAFLVRGRDIRAISIIAEPRFCAFIH